MYRKTPLRTFVKLLLRKAKALHHGVGNLLNLLLTGLLQRAPSGKHGHARGATHMGRGVLDALGKHCLQRLSTNDLVVQDLAKAWKRG